MNVTNKQRVFIFIIAVGILTAIAQGLGHFIPSKDLASLFVMVTPALAAFVVSFATRRPLKEIGWRVGPPAWIAAGWAIPVLYGLCAYGSIWLLGLGSVPNPVFLERARLTLSMPTQSDGVVIAAAFGFITIVNLLPALILSLGEEIGWRGFLVPELTQWLGFRSAAVLSGVIWALWHLPGIVTGHYGTGETPLMYRLGCFFLLVIFSGIMLAWFRMRTGSIWAAAVFHATHNGVIQAFFDRITADTGPTKYFTGEFGIALVPFMVVLGWYFLRRPIPLRA